MKKRRMPIKQNPGRMGMQTLPGLENLAITDEAKAENFLSKIMDKDFVGKHELYLTNYINSDISVALDQIKKGYLNYVVKGNWSEEKYETVVNYAATTQRMLIPNTFIALGIQFDNGEIQPEVESAYDTMSDEDILAILKNNF